MGSRSHLMPVLLASALSCGSVAGCSATPPPSTSAETSRPEGAITLAALQPGEYRSSPDPRTLLSRELHDELMRNADSKQSRCRHRRWAAGDAWYCTVVTLYPGRRDRDAISIELTVRLPWGTQGATAQANDMLEQGKKHLPAAGASASRLGDQGYESNPDPQEFRHAEVAFRIRNVVASVTILEVRPGQEGTEAKLFTDQQRRARRLAIGLSQAVPRLPH